MYEAAWRKPGRSGKGDCAMLTKTKETLSECLDDIFCGVNTCTAIDSASDLEKKHLPIITAPKKVKKGEHFDVEVEVGKLLKHPMEPGHFIEFIELYVDDTYLCRMDFTANTTCPIMKACVCLDHGYSKLRAFERCNLHGTWQYEVGIQVE
jgi:superoxide reductase